MEIDIRNHTNEEVTEIRFGSGCYDMITLVRPGGSVLIAQGDSGEVMIEDIDNLILALQKAKELWS